MKYKLEDICLKITDGSHYSPADDVNSDMIVFLNFMMFW